MKRIANAPQTSLKKASLKQGAAKQVAVNQSAGTKFLKVGAVDPTTLGEARMHAHYALQWLARVARCYLAPRADDSHTALSWISADQAFVTRPLPNGIGFGLVIAELTLFCYGPEGYYEELPLDGLTDQEVGEWIKDILQGQGYKSELMDVALPYSLPYYPLQGEGTYDSIDTAIALRELAIWFNDAHQVLIRFARENIKNYPRISPLLCWPHHFDMALLIQLEANNPQSMSTIGIGLSPGDQYYNQPYFYVTPWPYLKPQLLPDLPFIGQWHVQGFVGAVALSSRIVEVEAREKALFHFLREAVAIGRNRHAHPSFRR